MISNPRQLWYTCIAKGSVVVAELVSKEEAGIEGVALRCIEKTPPHHSTFSHTVGNKTYTFAMDESFVYFAILDEAMERAESLWLLDRLRSAVEDLMRGGGWDWDAQNPVSHCLQSKLDPVFAEIVGSDFDLELESDMDLVGSPRSVARESRNPSIDSTKGRKAALMPLLGKALKKKKKKRLHTESEAADVATINEKETRNDHHQKAKQKWRKHVWLVLMFDFCVCALLFGIWLWLCQGFQCIDG